MEVLPQKRKWVFFLLLRLRLNNNIIVTVGSNSWSSVLQEVADVEVDWVEQVFCWLLPTVMGSAGAEKWSWGKVFHCTPHILYVSITSCYHHIYSGRFLGWMGLFVWNQSGYFLKLFQKVFSIIVKLYWDLLQQLQVSELQQQRGILYFLIIIWNYCCLEQTFHASILAAWAQGFWGEDWEWVFESLESLFLVSWIVHRAKQ